MPYVHISRVPGRGIADFRAIQEEVGRHDAPGQIAMVAGEADGDLHIVDVWESKAQADRYAAEQLFPAFQRSGRGPRTDASYITFDTDEIILRGGAR